MRTRMLILTGALLVASAGFAQAQDTTPTSTQVPAAARRRPSPRNSAPSISATAAPRSRATRPATTGSATSATAATSTGSASTTRPSASRSTPPANNVGYRDQQYRSSAESIGKVKASFAGTRFRSTGAGAGLLFKDAGTGTRRSRRLMRAAFQNAGRRPRSAGVHEYPRGGTVVRHQEPPGHRAFDMIYTAESGRGSQVQLCRTRHRSAQPHVVRLRHLARPTCRADMGVPVDDRTTDVKGQGRVREQRGLLAVGYDRSCYNQNVPGVDLDNPLRLTDSATAGPAFGKTRPVADQRRQSR